MKIQAPVVVIFLMQVVGAEVSLTSTAFSIMPKGHFNKMLTVAYSTLKNTKPLPSDRPAAAPKPVTLEQPLIVEKNPNNDPIVNAAKKVKIVEKAAIGASIISDICAWLIKIF